jgi:hypothetical protein
MLTFFRAGEDAQSFRFGFLNDMAKWAYDNKKTLKAGTMYVMMITASIVYGQLEKMYYDQAGLVKAPSDLTDAASTMAWQVITDVSSNILKK